MNSKKLLALLLAATLLTGSLCGPVFAARAGQTAGAEFLEEIPPETIFTEKTDASAEGEAAGEYSTALETAAEEPAGTADPEAPDAFMDQSSEQIEENGLEAFSDGADLLEEPGDPAQQAEDNALEASSEDNSNLQVNGAIYVSGYLACLYLADLGPRIPHSSRRMVSWKSPRRRRI